MPSSQELKQQVVSLLCMLRRLERLSSERRRRWSTNGTYRNSTRWRRRHSNRCKRRLSRRDERRRLKWRRYDRLQKSSIVLKYVQRQPRDRWW